MGTLACAFWSSVVTSMVLCQLWPLAVGFVDCQTSHLMCITMGDGDRGRHLTVRWVGTRRSLCHPCQTDGQSLLQCLGQATWSLDTSHRRLSNWSRGFCQIVRAASPTFNSHTFDPLL